MLDRFVRRRGTTVRACIGFGEDLLRLRRGIITPGIPLLGQEGFLRYFRVTLCAAEYWLEVEPER